MLQSGCLALHGVNLNLKKNGAGGGGGGGRDTRVLIDYVMEIYTSKLGVFFLTLFENIWMPPLILLQGYFKGFFDA